MPDDRTYPDYPIPCAATILLRDDHVLLVQRGSEPNARRWSFPGGAMELGETAAQCALRETQEETGLEIELLGVADVVDQTFLDPGGRIEFQYLIVDYLARPVGGCLSPDDDVLDARWVPFESIRDYDLAPPTGEVLRKAILLWRRMTASTESA